MLCESVLVLVMNDVGDKSILRIGNERNVSGAVKKKIKCVSFSVRCYDGPNIDREIEQACLC